MLTKNSVQRIITGLILVFNFWALIFYCPPILFSIFLLIVMIIMLIELKNMIQNNTLFYTLALLYIIIPSMILIFFNQSPTYKNLLLYLFLLVCTFDSASYITGKLCGKLWITKKIIPSISPGKSWEGFLGGYITTTSTLYLITSFYGHHLGYILFFLSAIMCIIAFCGDIFESYLKRSANLKDSGTILPGHGGLLDRFDAILVVSYLFFIFKDYLLTIFP